ncbi:hypothetical protein quinque_002047 [Culex quinquefasciatus]
MLSRGNISPMFYRILSRGPPNFAFCFAYGSGVKQQLGYDKAKKKQNMIDLIYTVDNAHRWHVSNLERNPDHYSGLGGFGGNFIAKYQETLGAKVFFNTLIPIPEEDVVIKYGVVSTKDLLDDLTDWTSLYLAGRLHKPVEIIKTAASSKLQNALESNLKAAVHAALLVLPEKFTEFELYRAISNLSYAGDFRMIFGENKDKVNNIVRPQLENFRNLYSPTLTQLSRVLYLPVDSSDNVVCIQDQSEQTILYHLNHLPKWPVRRIVYKQTKGRYRQDTEDILTAVSKSSNYQEVVSRCLRSIVWQSSVKQSIKNIPSAGISKSIKVQLGKSAQDVQHDDHLGKDDAPDDQFGPALPPAMYSKAPEQQSPQSAQHCLLQDSSPPRTPSLVTAPSRNFRHFPKKNPMLMENDDFIGPAIPGASTSKAQLELEKRALETKLRRFDSEDAKASNATAREDWMLELPDIRKVPDMGLGARQFRTREKPEIGDRSVWTDTPSDKERKKATGGGHSSRDAKRNLEEETELLRIAQRDKQQEEQVKRHKKKHKRDKSLLDIHQKKLKKEKKDKDEPTRRPFDRNVDLHANRFDDAQKKAIMKKAQLLDTRFSSGGSKFL